MELKVLKPVLEGRRCVILGFGREGRVWLDILRRLDCCAEIAVADIKQQDIGGVTLHCGEDYLQKCRGYDLILQSPGVIIKDHLPPEDKAKILTQTELLLRLKPCKIIGITGTKGKSTTSALTHHFLSYCGFKTMLVGNIGVPPLELLEEMTEDTVAVCEMSCHQLEFARHSPDIAVLLNIFPEHLDHYISFEAYADAKRNICRFQGAGDTAIVNSGITAKCGGLRVTAAFGKSADIWTDGEKIVIFGKEIPQEDIRTKLRGRHNLYNIAVALAAAVTAGAELGECLEALESFSGLEHRLEYVATVNGAEYINDSISTIPEAAIAAVKAFDNTDCLILGGMDRGIPYDILGDFLNTGIVENVILLPDSGERIGALITNLEVNVIHARDMEQAVREAAKCEKRRVILSPAAASYGFYKNFEERGRHFKQLIKNMRYYTDNYKESNSNDR